jgi:hypothetical protein
VKDVVVHIGTGKTGTSALQEFLGRNRATLARAGVLYPQSVGKYRHVKLGLMVTPLEDLDKMIVWRRAGADDPEAYQADVRRQLDAELAAAGLPRVVFSNEGFYGSRPGTLTALRRYLDEAAHTVRIVVYLRRQDDHLLSRYQQRVKVGAVDRLAEWATTDLTDIYDYARRLRLWQDLLAPSALVVRPFERAQLSGGSIFQDFLDAAAIDLDASGLEQVGRTNESLDAESVELLRLLNLHQVEHHGATPGQIDNRELLKRVFARPRGPVLGLGGDVLDRFMARWAASNAEVARVHLGREDGVLFRSSERTADVTTRQTLEPARAEQLMAELDFPVDERAGVLRIAEREIRTAAAG